MKIKSSLALPTWSYEEGTRKLIPYELDYECIADVEDDGTQLVIKGIYVHELELALGAHQLTQADKNRILFNLKLN